MECGQTPLLNIYRFSSVLFTEENLSQRNVKTAYEVHPILCPSDTWKYFRRISGRHMSLNYTYMFVQVENMRGVIPQLLHMS